MSNTDLVCRTPRLPVAGETVAGSTFETFAGGKGANQAVAVARAGASVMFCGAVGDDQYGVDRAEDLKREGIDLAGLQHLPGIHSGIALIVVDDRGENQIVTVAGANGRVDPDTAHHMLTAHPHDVLMMTWELDPLTSMRILHAARDETTIVLNAAPFDASIHQVLPDDRLILICNEIEASLLLNMPVDESSAGEAVVALQQLGCRAAVITIGAAGAVATDGRTAFSAVPPEVTVVDTTGAGDSFCGAFAAWIGAGASIHDALLAGVHAGALATTRNGAQPSIPRREDVEASLAATGSAS